jgi:ribosomal protein S18 acetylase RimI-like enzyme
MTKPPDILIRPAGSSDAADIARFNSAMALETENKLLEAATIRAGVEAVLADARHGFYLVAESRGFTVGCLMITYEWSDWRNGQWWWLQSVYVVPEARRLGVFRALYARVEQQLLQAPGVIGLRLYVEKDNVHARGTYTALGMHDTGYRLYEKGLGAIRATPAAVTV